MTVTAAQFTAPRRHRSLLSIGIAVVALCVQAATGWGEHLQIGACAVLLTATAYVAHALAVVSGRVAPRSL